MIWHNRRGMEVLANWVVIWFIGLLVGGFILSILTRNTTLAFIMIFAAGATIGHFIFTATEGNRFPYYVLGSSFIVGWLIGSRHNYGLLILTFVLSIFIGYFSTKAAR